MTQMVVTPQVVDGIEFFVSGKLTGVSASGLARLCGVHHSAIGKLVSELNANKSTVKKLEHLQGKVFHSLLERPGVGVKAPIITSEAAVAIIGYYAYESKAANETAKYSFQKFAAMGFDNWVRSITGHAQEGNDPEVMNLLSQLISEVKEMKQPVIEYTHLLKTTQIHLPGMNDMINYLAKANLPPDSENLTTVAEYLEAKGYDRSLLQRVSQVASNTYKSLTKQDPPVKKKHYPGKGMQKVGQGYKPEHLFIIETALQKVISAS